MMPLPEEGKEKISVEAEGKVEEPPKFPSAVPGCSQPATKQGLFDVEFLVNAVERCLQEEGIVVDAILDIYTHVARSLEAMGTVFGLIAREIFEKVHVLRTFRTCADKDLCRTVESVLKSFRDTPHQNWFIAARALLRLHDALPCVSGIIRILTTDITEKRDEVLKMVKEVFNKTMAHHIAKDVKKIINVFMSIPPSIDAAVKQLVGNDPAHLVRVRARIVLLCDRLDHLFEVTKKLYAKYGMLNLPF